KRRLGATLAAECAECDTPGRGRGGSRRRDGSRPGPGGSGMDRRRGIARSGLWVAVAAGLLVSTACAGNQARLRAEALRAGHTGAAGQYAAGAAPDGSAVSDTGAPTGVAATAGRSEERRGGEGERCGWTADE